MEDGQRSLRPLASVARVAHLDPLVSVDLRSTDASSYVAVATDE
jgi:hypothetical protein